MTDETTDTNSAVDTAEPDAAAPAEAPDAGAEAAPAAAAPVPDVPFWQRPNVERYLVPLVMPIVVVVGFVVFVLNLSRVFLSAHGHISVIIGSAVLLTILVGATVLSNSSRLRSPSIVLMTAGFVFVIVTGGWLVLGSSQEKNVGGTALTAAGPSSGTIAITAQPGGGPLVFGPSSLTVKTGIYLVTLTDGVTGPHTLDFDQASELLWSELQVGQKGEVQKTRIFLGTPGSYTFYCAVPGHRSAGMQGTINVTGTPMTLTQAEAAAGSGGGGAAGGSGASGA